ncbi:MAG: flavin-dependent oxidoreductase [Roseomonas sp.]|nr:flavin-dependent oxidoreductase [Roseomonas sp.]MCA3326040.1 flavin-dependent oxidoreductase [Roseomonas sp.]MCA3332210.1 flavin-dependent oxidoreductase [Roseomonas sp.]MCA3335441.1 flavin-dependent oxidoreductase [Roseomonas sp.]MCA3347489.1 flavin-dependent oxidoreductase [Roseomonas sp.]
MQVLIAGGGVGGLALALMLHQRGIGCTVLEAAAEVKPLGVGINTLPHAIRELAALDLLPALDGVGIRTRELRYLNRFGQEIWKEPRGIWAGHEVPQFSIHRGHLHQVLWQAAEARLPKAALLRNARLQGFTQSATGITAHLADGRSLSGDVLIGADGIHSTIRAALHPDDGGIRWNGIQMWRGAVEWPAFEGGDTMIVAGDMKEKLVLYPIGAGSSAETRLTNWVVCAQIGDASKPPPRREDWSRPGQLDEVLAHVARFRIPFLDVAALVRATPEFWEYPMCDRDPLPFWTQGRVTLLGDAAHPMYPVGSNGASQAVLDARCLADLLASHAPEAALAAYAAERLPKTAEIVRANRKGGPERVVDEVSARAPDGFTRLEDVMSREELAAIAGGYAQMAGFAAGKRA